MNGSAVARCFRRSRRKASTLFTRTWGVSLATAVREEAPHAHAQRPVLSCGGSNVSRSARHVIREGRRRPLESPRGVRRSLSLRHVCRRRRKRTLPARWPRNQTFRSAARRSTGYRYRRRTSARRCRHRDRAGDTSRGPAAGLSLWRPVATLSCDRARRICGRHRRCCGALQRRSHSDILGRRRTRGIRFRDWCSTIIARSVRLLVSGSDSWLDRPITSASFR